MDNIKRLLEEEWLLILSEVEAVNYIPLVESSVLIRISDPGHEMPKVKGTWELIETYRFHDITKGSFSALMAGYTVPTEEILKPLVDSLSYIDPKQTFVAIHCGAGISRSAAVAQVYAEYTGRPQLAEYISTCGIFLPNNEVVKILRNLWNL